MEQSRLDRAAKVAGATVGGVALAWLALVAILLLVSAGLWIKWQFEGDGLPSDPVARCLAIGNQYQSTWWRANAEEGDYRDHDCARICGPLDDFVLQSGTQDLTVCPNGARPSVGSP